MFEFLLTMFNFFLTLFEIFEMLEIFWQFLNLWDNVIDERPKIWVISSQDQNSFQWKFLQTQQSQLVIFSRENWEP